MRDVVQINTKRGAFSVGIQPGRGVVDPQCRAAPTLPAEFTDLTDSKIIPGSRYRRWTRLCNACPVKPGCVISFFGVAGTPKADSVGLNESAVRRVPLRVLRRLSGGQGTM